MEEEKEKVIGAKQETADVAVEERDKSVAAATNAAIHDATGDSEGAKAAPKYKIRPLTEQAEREMKTLEFMIGIYCRKKHKHKDGLCSECQDLLDYARLRRSLCPFGDKKTFCSNCKIHCYKPEMHEKMRNVMKFAGPRMMFYDPKQAFNHVAETIRVKRQRKREEKERLKKQKAKEGKT